MNSLVEEGVRNLKSELLLQLQREQNSYRQSAKRSVGRAGDRQQ
jgi:hypothetical protein